MMFKDSGLVFLDLSWNMLKVRSKVGGTVLDVGQHDVLDAFKLPFFKPIFYLPCSLMALSIYAKDSKIIKS
jgi:hypothetical protein